MSQMSFQQGLMQPDNGNLALKCLRRPALRFGAQLDLYEQPELVRLAKAALCAELEVQQPRNVAFFVMPLAWLVPS